MGVLSALGRSGALSRNTQNLTNLAISLRQMRNKEISDERSNAISLRRLELAESADVRQADAAEREATAFQWQQDEQRKKKAFDEAVTPVDQMLANATPSVKEKLLSIGKENGWVKEQGGVLVISNLHKREAAQMLNEDLALTKTISDLHIKDLQDMKQNLEKQRDQLAAEKPNDKMLETMNAQLKAIDKQLTSAVNANLAVDKAHQAKMREQEAKAKDDTELERQKQANRIALERKKSELGKETSVKDSELRQQLKEVYGLSEYLLTTMNPTLRGHFNEASRIAAYIANDPTKFGLPADARAGAIAARAKELEEVASGSAPKERPPIESFGKGK